MSKAPAENHEAFKDADPRLIEASKASPEQSKERLLAMLTLKDERMTAFVLPNNDAKSQEKLEAEKGIVDRRLELIESMA